MIIELRRLSKNDNVSEYARWLAMKLADELDKHQEQEYEKLLKEE